MATTPVRAAQYLRMSTEHQRYSLENQALSIGAYAGRHGLRVDRTYEDAGKSGLTIRGRGGLKSLLADILSGSAPFDAVLVLDVSRWGRFQDPDEAAHYEFLCKEAGIAVHYCAEMFENDGSLVSSLLKSLKRVMAGEFSAELSRKTLQAQTRQAARGFKQGGSAPFGFRRLLVDARGEARQLLAPGEQKAMHNERVVYCLGPEAETRALSWIFEQYLSGSHPPAIAAALNAAGVANSVGSRWNAKAVLSALRHELAVGDYVFNRSTARMRTAQRANPPGLWVRTACKAASNRDP